jgi:hypothetical protein
MKSLAILAGLFCMLQLSGCQDGKSPEEVTTLFWQALSQGQIENAKKHVTQDSQHLVNLQDIEKHSTISTGEAFIDDINAVVETTIFRNKKQVTFKTVLLKEQDIWKINYLNTQMNISMVPFGDVVKSLQSLGDTFAKQLEQQVPLIQKEMESLGNDLKNQIDELGQSLKKPEKPNNPNTTPGSI